VADGDDDRIFVDFRPKSTATASCKPSWHRDSHVIGCKVSVLEHATASDSLRARSCLPRLSCANDEHGAVGVADHRVRDAAHKRPPYTPASPAANHDEAGVEIFGQVDDFPWRIPHRQV